MYIVASRASKPDSRGRQPLIASGNPVVHPDEGMAVEEAQRLAQQQAGAYEYYVFKAVKSVKVKNVPVEVSEV